MEGDILVTSHALNTQVNEKTGVEVQRENIQYRPCSMIIDGGNCANVVRSTILEKLNFPIFIPFLLHELSLIFLVLVSHNQRIKNSNPYPKVLRYELIESHKSTSHGSCS